MRFVFEEVAVMDRTPIEPCKCGKGDWGNTSTVYAHGALWNAASVCLSCLNSHSWFINPDKPLECQSLPSKTHREGKL